MEERSYGAVVLDEGGRYLLIQHRNGGHWDFPKGHKENGETGKAAALREVLEETGLEIRLMEGFKVRTRYVPQPGTQKTVTFYLGVAEGAVAVQEEEVLNHGYFSYAEAMLRITYPESRKLLEQAEEFRKQFWQIK